MPCCTPTTATTASRSKSSSTRSSGRGSSRSSSRTRRSEHGQLPHPTRQRRVGVRGQALTLSGSRAAGRSEDEARAVIAACKKQYHDARHNCWCYLLRDGTERYSDDGEPQGTAGIPMLEVFRRAGVTNVVCVVTRYFGGVLLGTGGLLRAYTAAAADALADAGISVVRRWLACEVSMPYALYEPVRAAVAALGGVVQETQYAAAVTLCALLPEEAGEAFAAQVRDLTAGRCAVRPVGETERAVPLADAGL
ncbi:MAG: IMPACT family protein [Oscillospiraceae bacterium]